MITLAPGQTIRVPSAYYAFGEKDLHMHITEIVGECCVGGYRWAELKGHDVRPDGRLDPFERFANVRVDMVRIVAEEAAEEAGV